MKNSKIWAVTVVAVGLVLAGCSSTGPKIEIAEFEPGSCRFKQGSEVAPDWYCAPDSMFDQQYVYGIGSAGHGYSDEYLARKIALTSGRADIASKVSTQILEEYERKIMAQEIDQNVYEEIETYLSTQAKVDLRLPSSRKKAQVYDAAGNIYVLVEIERRALEDEVNKIRSEADRLARQKAKNASTEPSIVVDALRETRIGQ